MLYQIFLIQLSVKKVLLWLLYDTCVHLNDTAMSQTVVCSAYVFQLPFSPVVPLFQHFERFFSCFIWKAECREKEGKQRERGKSEIDHVSSTYLLATTARNEPGQSQEPGYQYLRDYFLREHTFVLLLLTKAYICIWHLQRSMCTFCWFEDYEHS